MAIKINPKRLRRKLGDGGPLGKDKPYNLNEKGLWSPTVWNGDMYTSMVRNGVISPDTLSQKQFSNYSLDQVTKLVNANPDFLRVQKGTSSTNNWGKTFLAKDGYVRPPQLIPAQIKSGTTLQGYETDWQPGQSGSGNITKKGDQIYFPPQYEYGGYSVPGVDSDYDQSTLAGVVDPNTTQDNMGMGDMASNIAQGAGMAGQIMNPIIGAIRGVKDVKMQNLYNNASSDLREVDVRKMGNLSRTFIGVASSRKGRAQAKQFNEDIREQRFNQDVGNRMATMDQNPTYMPVAKQGGFTIYKGETHKGPNGGILTDEQGNPTGLSNNKPIALTEKNEVARYDPNSGSTYIYSDSLGFAKPATLLVNKYKLTKDNSLYKYDPLLKTAVDKQFDNLTTAQEFAKGTKTSAEESIGMFGKGGRLTASKASKMLDDNSAHKKPLTKKQRAYFQMVAHGMVPNKEEGGLLELHEGGPVGHTHKEDRPDYYYDRYGSPHLMPEIMEQRLSESNQNNISTIDRIKQYNKDNPRQQINPDDFIKGKLPGFPKVSNSVMKFLLGKKYSGKGTYTPEELKHPWNEISRGQDNTSNVLNTVGSNVNDTYTSDFLDPNYLSSENILQRNREFYDNKTNQSNYGLSSRSRLNMVKGNPTRSSNVRVGRNTVGSPSEVPTSQLNIPSNFYKEPFALRNGLAKGPSEQFSSQEEEQYSPTLSPLGHIASALGSWADYSALKNAKPTDVSLPRVGAERISLANQRVANERNAANSRAINTASARNLGMNAGATFSNTAVANTGVNRLLGQQNAESLMNEENVNAQFRQQANNMNAELGAKEGLFNTQQSNAYRMALAQNNPLGNLARIGASYAKDNSAYGRQYDMAKLLNSDAEIFKPDDQNFLDWLVGQGPGARVRDKSLYR